MNNNGMLILNLNNRMKHYYVCDSVIEGSGLRAGENMKRGDEIFEFEGPVRFKINKTKRDALAHPNWVGLNENHWIEPGKPHKFMNHSCNPNVGMKDKLTVVALRIIKEGEELTIDYSTFEGDPRWEMNCLCGDEHCRKVISSIHSLPPKQFSKYLPFVPDYFKELYLKNKKVKV